MEFATGAFGTLLPKLGQLLQHEYNLHKGVKKNIKFLTGELQSIQDALRSVGKVPPDQLSGHVKLWARDARELSYDMEDIVDTFLVRVQGSDERPSKRSAKRFIKNMMCFVTKAKIQHNIGQEIEDIKERIMELATRRERYKLDEIIPAKTPGVDPRITSLYADVANLVGIEETRKELITMLSTQQRIVSVVGFGGLGKTTLAKAVYEKLKGKFDCTAFIPVGRNPVLKKVLRDILIDLDKEGAQKINLEILDERQLIDKLKAFLENKRYFIVIDDVWDIQSWGIIKLAFVENNSGSRVIITTRTREVARDADEVYELQPLSHANSRKLFFARVSGDESSFSNHQPDDEVSNKILRKCGGIPLAIITMASLLVDRPTDEWLAVHRCIGFGRNENQQVENTKKIISFSYYDLPSHLRACLLYLSVFPEDYFVEKATLIWMWIAEDFVDKVQGKSLFEIGEGYFNELVNRSMIQLEEKWEEWERELIGCQIHDMVLDLIRGISSEENFVTILDDNNEGEPSHGRSIRRLALQNNRTAESHMKDMQQVRSFISCGCSIDKGIPLSSFKFIRVLAIYTSSFGHLKHLRNLLHLRYLQLCGGIVKLPEEIGTLKFLETLHVDYLVNPKVVSLLTQLRCLRIRDPVIFDGIRKITSLVQLQISLPYALEEEDARSRFLKELGSLRELRVLVLRCWGPLSMEKQIDVVESLSNLENIKHLSLSILASEGYVDTTAWEAAGFRLARNIRLLLLNWASFSRFPSFCIKPSLLPHLSHLVLCVDAIDEQELQILGQLPELRFLDLYVESTMEMVCSTTTDPAGDGGCFFQKLRRCILRHSEVLLLPGKDDSSGVSFRMRRVRATVLLGSEWKGVSSGKGLMPILMPRVHKLTFRVSVREFKDENHGVGLCLCLEYFASLQNIRVDIRCDGASDAEVEEVQAWLKRSADVHPNHPTVETYSFRDDKV